MAPGGLAVFGRMAARLSPERARAQRCPAPALSGAPQGRAEPADRRSRGVGDHGGARRAPTGRRTGIATVHETGADGGRSGLGRGAASTGAAAAAKGRRRRGRRAATGGPRGAVRECGERARGGARGAWERGQGTHEAKLRPWWPNSGGAPKARNSKGRGGESAEGLTMSL